MLQRLFIIYFVLLAFVGQAQAGVIFALRGDSLTPRYARGGKLYSQFLAAANFGTPAAVITASSISATGTKGSSLIDVHRTNSDERALKYVAGRNWVTGTNVFTIRYSFVPNWSGNPPVDQNLMIIGSNPNQFYGGIRLQIFDNGKLSVAMTAGDGAGSGMLSGAITSSALTFVNKQKTEIQISCDGTNVYASQDGVAVGSWPLIVTDRYMNGVLAGQIYLGVYPVDTYIDELLIFDTAESQTYTPSGSYLSVADLDGTSSADPGEANVRSGTGYTIAGVAKTGTAAIPGASSVKVGVATDATTGTYDGSDRWTCPGAGDLRLSTTLKCNSTSTNLTGTLASPALSAVKIGVAGDGGTGTYDGSDRWTCPLASQLEDGVQLQCNSTTVNRTGTRQTVTNILSNATMSGPSRRATLRAR